MNKRDLDKKMLDKIGQRLIGQSAVSLADVDRITADPALFSRIQKRIAANNAQSASFSLFKLIRQNAAVFAALFVLLTVGIAAVTTLRTDRSSVARNAASTLAEMPKAARPDVGPLPVPPLRTAIDQTSGRAADHNFVVEKTVAKTRAPQPKTRAAAEADNQFYAVSSVGDLSETAGDSRIIRVDMPRSSLFAMGVNVPLENDSETIKADLLVGSDGVARAIRVVK